MTRIHGTPCREAAESVCTLTWTHILRRSRKGAGLNETFHCPLTHKQLLAKSSRDSAQTWFSKAASFVGAMRGCACAPTRRKMPFPLCMLLALQVLICTRRQPRCPQRNLRPCKRTCNTHTAAATMHGSSPSLSTYHPPGHTGKHTHNKRPGPGHSFQADLVFAPQPVLTMTSTSASSFVWLSIPTDNVAKSRGPPLAPLPSLKPGGTRQKRQVPAAVGRPAHNAPGRGQAGQGRAAAFRGTVGRAAAANLGVRPALGAPRLRAGRALRGPGATLPAAPVPS
jgi:hypothetical protein